MIQYEIILYDLGRGCDVILGNSQLGFGLEAMAQQLFRHISSLIISENNITYRAS